MALFVGIQINCIIKNGTTLTKHVQTSHAFLKDHTEIMNNKLTKPGRVVASFL